MKNKVILFVLILFLVIAINNFCNASTETIDLTIDFNNNPILHDLGYGTFNCTTFKNNNNIDNISSYTDLVTAYDHLNGIYVVFFNPNDVYYALLNYGGTDGYVFGIYPKNGNTFIGLRYDDDTNELYSTSYREINFTYGSYDYITTSFIPHDYYGNEISSDDFYSGFTTFLNTYTVATNGIIVTPIISSSGNGLQGFISSFLNYINVDTMFTIFGNTISLIVVAVLFVLGFTLFRKLLYRFK